MLSIFAVISNKEKRNKLEDLYTEYALYLYKVAYNILKDKYLAQDAVHEAFIKISNNIDKIFKIDCNKTKAFIVVIVRNISINLYNQRKKQSGLSFEELGDDLSKSGQSVEETVISNEEFSKVADKIHKLHPSYADILLLKYYFYYKDEEISLILNITSENTRIRLHRARKCLLELLSQDQEANNHE